MAESIRIDMAPVIRAVDSLGRELGSQISDVRLQVDGVASDVHTTRSDLLELKKEFLDFVHRTERQRALQLAETRLSTLKSDLEREYGHYGVVRRTSVGILQAFDMGNVRNKTVHEVSEELELQTPKYWLAPALVALAAWSKDDQDLAQKSLEAAFSRDKKKTSLFFALVLRRQARLEEATRWLRHYFLALDPYALTREFAVLLEAISQDGFGPEGRQLVMDKLNEWRLVLRMDPEIVNNQLEKWRREIENKRASLPANGYEMLAKVSPQWPQIRSSLEASTAHQHVINKYEAVRETVDSLSASVADRLDDIIELLVTEFDDEELPLQREVLYQQAIIDHDGDADRAKAQAENDIAGLDETIDALTLQTSTALRPDLFGVSTSTQKLSVAGSIDDFKTATGQYAAAYRSQWPTDIDIVLGSDHSGYATTYGFDSWQTRASVPQAQAESALNTKWDEVLQRRIDEYTFTPQKVTGKIVAGAIAVFLGLLFLFMPGLWVMGLLVLLGGGGTAAFMIYKEKQRLDSALQQLLASRDKAKATSVDIYREAAAEWVDAGFAYDEEDAKEAQLLAMIEGWPL